jgi:protein-arginine deiminase
MKMQKMRRLVLDLFQPVPVLLLIAPLLLSYGCSTEDDSGPSVGIYPDTDIGDDTGGFPPQEDGTGDLDGSSDVTIDSSGTADIMVEVGDESPAPDIIEDSGTEPDSPPVEDVFIPDFDPSGGVLSAIPTGLYGVPNLDNDNNDNRSDWTEAPVLGENDYIDLIVHGDARSLLDVGDYVEISLTGDTDKIRIWIDGEPVMGYTTSNAPYQIGSGAENVLLNIEFKDFLVEGDLSVTHRSASGSTLDSRTVELIASPLILNHHLQFGESQWALDGGSWNRALITGFSEEFGAVFTALNGNDYEQDPWVQDEVELAYTTASDGHRLDIVIDLVRDGQMGAGHGLDNFPEDHLEGVDFGIVRYGSFASSTSQDYGGNIEVTPPVTVDGIEYPFGRIYWGDAGMWFGEPAQPEDAIQAVFQTLTVQDPFVIDTSWLCVGHVDEWLTWVPDPSSEKGFKMVYSDVDLGLEFMDTLDGSTSLSNYQSAHGYGNVNAIINDMALERLQEELRDDYLLPNLEILIEEAGLTEDDIIRIPALFEEAWGCGDLVAALIPGTANLQLHTYEDGRTVLLPPDPFLRANGSPSSSDPFIIEFESLLPEGLDYVWIDDFMSYHYSLGEVHCGTNVVRTPWTDWWTEAMHLIGD